MARTIYCTSFCNFGHVVETGRPVNHECYILLPAMLRAERDGNVEEAQRILQAKGKRGPVKGTKVKEG